MKSGRQKRQQIDAQRKERREAPVREKRLAERQSYFAALRELERQGEIAFVERAELAPTNSYGHSFELRGYYEPVSFACKSCGAEQVWTAQQQKWWYEVVKGNPYAGPSRCRACRAAERRRKDEARRTHLEGLKRKRGQEGGGA